MEYVKWYYTVGMDPCVSIEQFFDAPIVNTNWNAGSDKHLNLIRFGGRHMVVVKGLHPRACGFWSKGDLWSGLHSRWDCRYIYLGCSGAWTSPRWWRCGFTGKIFLPSPLIPDHPPAFHSASLPFHWPFGDGLVNVAAYLSLDWNESFDPPKQLSLWSLCSLPSSSFSISL